MDKSHYRSFLGNCRLGKYLTTLANSLLSILIADPQADLCKRSKLNNNRWTIFGHFVQSLLRTGSPTHRTKLSTKLSTVSVENCSCTSEIRAKRVGLFQIWDWRQRELRCVSIPRRPEPSAQNDRLEVPCPWTLQSLRCGGAGGFSGGS